MKKNNNNKPTDGNQAPVSNEQVKDKMNFEHQGKTYTAPESTVNLLRKYDKEGNAELFGTVLTLGRETGDITEVNKKQS